MPFINQMATTLYGHECQIIDMIFEKGKIEGIDATELKMFVQSRIVICLDNLGVPCGGFEGIKNYTLPISEWFYKGINNYKMNDFFNRQGREYVRGWNEQGFTWK